MFNKLFRRRKRPGVPACVAVRRSSSAGLGYVSPSRSPGPFETPPPVDGFLYSGTNRADFYRYLRDRIPIISAGVWTWVHLCSTPQEREIHGGERMVQHAGLLLDRLEERIYPRIDGDARGLSRLTESFFLELFTLGRFAARVHILPDRSGISHVELLDPYRVRWVKDSSGVLHPWLDLGDDVYERLQPETFFYRTLVTDPSRPEGIEPLASIPFVVEIEQRMLEDMARASHNAGTPRLQVRITPPAPNPGEDADTYNSRINSYFENTVRQFDELGPDDNLFTWSDVEVRIVGGNPEDRGSWKLNREQIIEDVITGLKLFPWALGRSHGTTKNWIFAQYNLLMQIVDSVQSLGRDLAEWLMRLELRLAGSPVEAVWRFAPNQDPFIVERNRAKMIHFERIDGMVQRGYISLDQGARELGYPRAYRRERPPEQRNNIKEDVC